MTPLTLLLTTLLLPLTILASTGTISGYPDPSTYATGDPYSVTNTTAIPGYTATGLPFPVSKKHHSWTKHSHSTDPAGTGTFSTDPAATGTGTFPTDPAATGTGTFPTDPAGTGTATGYYRRALIRGRAREF